MKFHLYLGRHFLNGFLILDKSMWLASRSLLYKLCVSLIVIILHLNIEPLILNLIKVELNLEPSCLQLSADSIYVDQQPTLPLPTYDAITSYTLTLTLPYTQKY